MDPKHFDKEKLFSKVISWTAVILINIEIFFLFFTYVALVSQLGFVHQAKL
jgi:hypothetical protein